MRATSILLLLLFVGLAGLLVFLFWMTPGPDPGLNGPTPVGQPVEISAELPEAARGLSAVEGGRSEVPTEQPAEAVIDSRLTDAELASIDSNALIGQVVDAEGNGISGCEVTFVDGGLRGVHSVFGGHLELEGAPQQWTDHNGAFRFERITPGDQHALRVHHPEISLRFVEGVRVGDFGEYEEPPILLVHGKRIRGVVTNELNVPVVGAEVHLDGQWRPNDPQPSYDRMSTLTNNEGKYEILGVPDGTRCLTVVAPNMGRITRIQSLIFSDATGQAHVANVKLLGTAYLTGRVTDVAGNGIAGIDLLAVDRKAYRDVSNDRTVSLADGSFAFPNLSRGVVQVTANAPGFKPVVMADQQVPQEGLNIILGDQRLMHGAVVAASDGRGVPVFEVQMMECQGGAESVAIPRGASIRITAGEGGRFSMPLNETRGLWRLQATAPGFAVSVSEPFEVGPSGDVQDVLVAMTLGGTIRGRLLNESGAPVPGGRVTSRDNSWTDDAFSQLVGMEEGHAATVLEVRSGKDGRFVLSNLRPAMYQLIARSGELHQVALGDLRVEEGGALDVGTITLLPGGGLHGSLFDSEGATVPGGSIFLNPVSNELGAPVRRCKSGADGRWQIKNIVPGSYKLSGNPPSEVDVSALGLWPSNDGDLVQIAGGVDDSRDIHLNDWTKPVPPAPEPPTGQLSGKLTDAAGNALVGNGVQLVPVSPGASPERGTKTAREGSFTFIKLLPGDYDLSLPGQPGSVKRVTIRIDAWTNQDLISAE